MKHKHQPFIAITCFFALGIMINAMAPGFFSAFCCLSIICLIVSMRFSSRSTLSSIFLLLSITAIGCIYGASRSYVEKKHISHVAKYHRKSPVALKGVIISDIQKRIGFNGTKTTFTLNVDEVQAKWGWQKNSGKILVNCFKDLDISYGDRIQIEGKLHRPYNFSSDKNFSYQKYLHNRGIYYLLSVKKNSGVRVIARNKGNGIKSLSLGMRERLKDILSEHLSKNESGIMRAILLGDRSGIARPVRDLFVQTGTAHILAISGLHIGVVAGLFLICSRALPFGRRYQLGSVIALLVCYAFLTGGRPSVVRATVMMVVFFVSLIIEKEPDALNTLFLAAMLILAYNPLNLFDVGFQLSFVCVFSIIYLNLKFLRKKGKDKNQMDGRFEHLIGQSLTVSLAIWIAVAGLIAYYFGIITPITIFANLLVVPLISVVVTLGFGLLIAGVTLPVLAFMFAACLKVVLNAMVGLIFLCSKIPLAYFYVKDVKLWHVSIYYAVLVLALVCPWHRLFFKRANMGEELTKS